MTFSRSANQPRRQPATHRGVTVTAVKAPRPLWDGPGQRLTSTLGEINMTDPKPPATPARTIWPGIGRGFAHEELPKHLFTVAALHARRALAAAEHQLDQLDRATSIGTAVELLAKAALTLISPTLIAKGDAKSQLLHSGIPAIPAHEAKTKIVTDCLSMLNHSHAIDFNPQRDSKVFLVRNFALHMGQVDATLFRKR